MKSILLLQSRPEKEVSEDEFLAFCKFAGVEPGRFTRLQMHEAQPELNLNDYSAIIMAGGPANFAYHEAKKSVEQKIYEKWLLNLMQKIVKADKPFLGVCLGMGALVSATGGSMSLDLSEPVTAVEVSLTKTGRDDPLCVNLPDVFEAFVGHKEGVSPENLPQLIKVLATSDTCAQLLKVGQNVYAAQFHPELDADGLAIRIKAYQHAGYFKPHEVDELIAAVKKFEVDQAEKLLQNFVKKYGS